MTYAQSILLAIVEGLTEYLPVSSTGHIILTSWALGIHEQPFVKDFTVMVQFGAILAVLVLYWRRFVLNFKVYPKVLLAFLPAAVIGLSLKKYIELLLGSVFTVGLALLIGGVLLILTDRWISRAKPRTVDLTKLSWRDCVQIGLFQCLALVPGTSRSAATIWGGLFCGLPLALATEFSFFLAVPTLTGATLLYLKKTWSMITPDQLQMLVIGNLVSFVVGLLAIKSFVLLINRYGLKYFGYYRIAAGSVVMLLLWLGHDLTLL
jgi:undecaprenyl-diphosphatase